jgi:hypothetical protein
VPAADPPEIRYAASGDVSIAYAVLGVGPLDLVFVYGFVGNLDYALENPYFPTATTASRPSAA